MTRPLLLFLLFCTLLPGAGCGPDAEPVALPPLDELNILLIVIDTLGADDIGCLGGPEGLTPNIDRLAESGVLFTSAVSPSSWTQPTVASIMTGLTPSRHDVLHLFDVLPEGPRTMASHLSARGHRTAGVISHFLINTELGYGRGFDVYDETPVGGHQAISSPQVTRRAIGQLPDMSDERPFFLFAHYFDPHSRYLHHPEFDRTSEYQGPARELNLEITKLRAERHNLDAADIGYLRGLYEEEVAFTDRHVGELLDALDARGLRENTLVILTSDHGEEFMEHDWIGHTRFLYDTLVRVPLIVSLPGTIRPREVDEPVSLLDLMPTVLELAGDQPVGMDGASLVDVLSGGKADPERALFSEVAFVSPEQDQGTDKAEKEAFLSAVTRGRWKMIHDLATDEWELYDLRRDPGEQRNLVDREADRAADLRDQLRGWESGKVARWGRKLPGAKPMSDEDLKRLRSLGYVR